MARPSSTEGKVDVALIYDLRSTRDRDQATTLRGALQNAGLRVKSYDDLFAGRYKLDNRALLVTDTWSVVMIVTQNFLEREAPEMYMALQRSSDERLHNIVYIKYTDMTDNQLSHACAYFNIIDEIDGSCPLNEQVAKVLTAVKDLKKGDAPTLDEYPFRGKARRIIDATALKLIHFFRMEEEMRRLHDALKKDVDEKNPANKGRRLDQWIKCIWKKINQWKGARPGQCFDGKCMTRHDANKILQENPTCLKIQRYFRVLNGLDEPTGYLCLASLLLINKPPIREAADCDNLAQYLDPDNIFELLKKCGVFPCWNESELRAINELNSARIIEAHQVLESSEDSERELIDLVERKTLSSYKVLMGVSSLEEEISQIKFVPRGAAANQSDQPEGQQDNVTS